MKKITLIIPYYRNPEKLKIQWETWNQYTKEIWEKLDIILIDDCSPEPASKILKHCLSQAARDNLKLHRVKKDIPWNQHGCRNLGARLANTKWLLMTDMDRIIAYRSMYDLVCSKLDDKFMYKPFQERVSANRSIQDELIPGNQFIVTKENFWKVGGYDEDYCGTYGGDSALLKPLEEIAPLEILPYVTMRHSTTEAVRDANTTTLDRRGEYHEKYKAIAKDKKARGDIFPKNPIRFEYERVMILKIKKTMKI